MDKYKYLFKNVGILALSSFATKLLSFFLVPLYTSVLTTTEYGTYDLFNATIGVLIPILTLNIQESVMRFALEKNFKREAIITIAMRYVLVSSGIVAAGLLIYYFFKFSELVNQYAILFFLMFLSQVLSGVILAYIRGIDKLLELSISSVIASVVTIGSNILFLLVFRLGMIGYFLANIIGPLVQCLFLMIRGNVFRSIHVNHRYREEKKEMVKYSKPMIANSIAWWINNVSDRYIVIFFCGLAENGIYSVASKIPTILNVFQSIFAQAWTLSAVKDFDPEDKNGFFTNTYNSYNCLMTIMCSVIIVFDRILAKFLYANEFYIAWKYVPWLTIAILFGSLSGYLGGLFSAVKNSKIFARSTMLGAVTNVVLNLILVPKMGALGAAIATAVCYIVVWIVRLFHSKKIIKLRINIYRDIISYAVLAIQSIALLVPFSLPVIYGIEVLSLGVIVLLYNKQIIVVIKRITHR